MATRNNEEKKTALAVVQDPAAFLPSAEELNEITEELKGVLTRSMLGTIQIANGGACCFKVKEPGADEATPGVQAIEGMILAFHPTNVLWGSDYGKREQGELPVCRSMDGVCGTILETGEIRQCESCPHNRFAEGHKECTNKMQLYIMRENDLVPMIFSLPPTGLKFFNKYLVRCRLTERVPMFSVVTRITLKNEQGQSGEYSVPVFTPVGKLPRDEAKRMSDYARAFAEAAQRSGIQADDLTQDGPAPATDPGGSGFAQVEMPPDELPFDVGAVAC